MLFLHLSTQRINLIKFLHDGVVIRIICAQKFTQFDVMQLQIRVGLYGSFLRIYTDRVQAANLFVRETKKHADAGIFRHAQKVLSTAELAPSTPFPSTMSALFAPAVSFELMRASTPSMRSAAKLMLAWTGARSLLGAILSPTDHRCRQ
jgi:hypothetical protein